MKQGLLADAVGCNRSRVSQLEGGEQWTVALALQFADALGVGLMDLVGDEPSAADALLMEAVRSKNYRMIIMAAQAALQAEAKKQ